MFKNKSLFLVGALLLLSLSCTHKGPDEPDSSATVSLTTARALCIKACGGNSDYAAAVKNLINSEVDCVQTKNGAYVNLDGVIDCINRALHGFA